MRSLIISLALTGILVLSISVVFSVSFLAAMIGLLSVWLFAGVARLDRGLYDDEHEPPLMKRWKANLIMLLGIGLLIMLWVLFPQLRDYRL